MNLESRLKQAETVAAHLDDTGSGMVGDVIRGLIAEVRRLTTPQYVAPIFADAITLTAIRALNDNAIPASNRYVRAIKEVRNVHGLLLKDAKDVVDRIREGRA